ncbi:MAG: hypothetical protein NTU44_09535 [Bacteroidetes bacterium]|nr:hypothetical protein [Bacteroidota bacterium]
MKFTGKILRKPFAPGSKSEHLAFILETASGDLVLRRQGANPFDNSWLNDYVGKKAEVTGTLQDYVLFVSGITLAED